MNTPLVPTDRCPKCAGTWVRVVGGGITCLQCGADPADAIISSLRALKLITSQGKFEKRDIDGMRYLKTHEDFTYRQIGDLVGVSYERVRQLIGAPKQNGPLT